MGQFKFSPDSPRNILVAFGRSLTTRLDRCQPVEAPFVTIGQISPFVFFLFFAITPIPGRVGRRIPNSYTNETDHT
ncbi:unnamed protein product [Ilex paraguariensis]|uniref:Uncharacterized protein n=1 Tax=Ilex paraguariensis TaxID=185542 RepID=A0ABC8UVQ0_9AQUA